MMEAIRERLAGIEREHRVRILHACESGSRAWGFESQDSDYDVRFIYALSRDDYLSIDERRDVIEYPIEGDLDINGWELRKALRLLRKSHPVLLEWLNSPISYAGGVEAIALRRLAAMFFDPLPCWHHYLSMARGNDRAYLHGDRVRLKKYLYVLRPLLACRWLQRHRSQVPVRFDALVDACLTEPDAVAATHDLLARKRAGGELEDGPPIPGLRRLIDDWVANPGEAPVAAVREAQEAELLDLYFRWMVLGAWTGKLDG